MTTNLFNKLKTVRSQAKHVQHKLSAVILYKGRPIAFGFNDQTRTHPAILKYSKDKTVHAEMSAMFKVKNRDLLANSVMVVYREDRHGNMALAKPCPVCQEMMKEYGITQVQYSSANGWVIENWKAK